MTPDRPPRPGKPHAKETRMTATTTNTPNPRSHTVGPPDRKVCVDLEARVDQWRAATTRAREYTAETVAAGMDLVEALADAVDGLPAKWSHWPELHRANQEHRSNCLQRARVLLDRSRDGDCIPELLGSIDACVSMLGKLVSVGADQPTRPPTSSSGLVDAERAAKLGQDLAIVSSALTEAMTWGTGMDHVRDRAAELGSDLIAWANGVDLAEGA